MGPALRRGEREMISWVYTMCPAGQRRKHHYRDILQLDNLLRNGLDYISHLIDLGIITLDEDDCADPRPPVSRWLNYDPLSDLDEALLRPPEDLPSCITTQVLFSQWRRNPSFEPYAAMIDNCSEADITRAIRAVQAELVKSGGYDLEEYLLPSQILDCINGDQNLADCIEHWWDSQEGIFNDFAVIGDLAKVDFILYMHSKRICFDFAGVEVPDSETAQWTYL
ncbi:hypothetical protein BZG36_02844 [Bifiguratus adelaidae]|uniref:Uncharacterized protein n=1 Tax=Bifiguratus adelaidae TaxID=1938954 RepID=A0A261Y0J6_9FUNG|nr:hypothetical protein BZG36_02844 [Bifiguratus adelaidae]